MVKKELKEELQRKKSELHNKRLIYALLSLFIGTTIGTYIIYSSASSSKPTSIEAALLGGLSLGAIMALINYYWSGAQYPQDEYLTKIRQKAAGVSLLITLLLLYALGILSKVEFQLQTAVSLFIITFGGIFWIVYLIMKNLN